MRKALAIAGLAVLGAAGAGAWLAMPTVSIGAAYSAKALCSGVFISGLDEERVFVEEVAHLDPAMSYLTRRIDHDNREVRVSALGLGGARAVFRDRAGCTLVLGGEPEALALRGPQIAYKPLAERRLDGPWRVELDAALDRAFSEPINGGGPGTRAVMIVHRGEVIGARFADDVGSHTPLKGWSMNKTLTGLLIGVLADRGWLDPDAPAPVPEWQGEGDPRAAITVRHLMTMSSGLGFDETYDDLGSDVVEMLFAQRSAGARGAAAPLAHAPGTHWSYSSGTTNVLARIAGDVLRARGLEPLDFMQDELLAQAGVASAYLEPDSAGDFIGSSFGYMTADDWARIGMLFVREGRNEAGDQVVSPEWIRFMMTDNGLSEGQYGAQLWLHRHDPDGPMPPIPGVPAETVFLSGHDGQMVAAIPSLELVVVRLGETPTWSQGAGAGDLLRTAVRVSEEILASEQETIEAEPDADQGAPIVSSN